MHITVTWDEPIEFQRALTAEAGLYKQGLFYITQVLGDRELSLSLGSAVDPDTVRQQLKRNSIYWQNFYSGKIMVRFGHVDGDIKLAEAAILHSQSVTFKEKIKLPEFESGSCHVHNDGNKFELPEVI